MKVKKRIVSILLALATLCSVLLVPSAAASTTAFDILSSTKYAKTFTLSNSGITIPYTSKALTTRGTVTYGASGTAYIENGTDELYLIDVGLCDGKYWAYVSYPISNKRAYAYISLSDITYNNGNHEKTVSSGKFYCSLRSYTALASSYYVSKGDTVYLVGISGDKYQILYPTSGTAYRLAWCNASDYKQYCGGTSSSGASARQNAMANQALNMLGSTQYNGYCQRFVRVVGQAIGLPAGNAASALAACNMWRVSTSSSNIPVGATVYLRTLNQSSSAYQYGHVGIYVGDGYVVHAVATVKKEKLSDMLTRYEYLGWGWQAGVDLTK